MEVDNSEAECGAKFGNDVDDRRGQIHRYGPQPWMLQGIDAFGVRINVGLS
jgi:hypothetical protein